MALGLFANVSPLDAPTNASPAYTTLNASFTKIAGSGRVSTPADEAPTHANGDATSAQLRGCLAAERNALDATSAVTTANDALGSMRNLLERTRALVVAGSSGPLSPIDRGKLQREFSETQAQLDQIKQTTSYNGTALLNSSVPSITFQVGSSGTADSQLRLDLAGFSWSAPPVTCVGDTDVANVQSALGSIDTAIQKVEAGRAYFGAMSSQLGTITQNIQTQRLNLSSANSNVRDASVAEGMANLTRNQILSQPGVSVVSQTHQLPQLSLNLLK